MHDKFVQYWYSIGKPPIESRLLSAGASWQLEEDVPPFFNFVEYRIAGDRHYQIRRLWIDSDFKLHIESKPVTGYVWFIDEKPEWLPEREYRIFGTSNMKFKDRHKRD